MDGLPCPGCGFLMYTVDEAYGSWFICPLCDWEDDPVQLANPLSGGGANGESLHAHQQRALIQWPLAVNQFEKQGRLYDRDSKWRPLSDAEVAFYESSIEGGVYYAFNAIDRIEQCYWMQSPVP